MDRLAGRTRGDPHRFFNGRRVVDFPPLITVVMLRVDDGVDAGAHVELELVMKAVTGEEASVLDMMVIPAPETAFNKRSIAGKASR